MWGNEKIQDISSGVGIYAINNDNRLIITEIKDIKESEVEDEEVFEIRTTGFRGKVKCDNDTCFIRKYKDDNGETKEEDLYLKDLKKGYRLKELNNSVLYFEFGDEIRTSSKIKSIKKNMWSGSIYDIEVDSDIKGIIVNSLVVVNN